jgi:hypothetical protein
MNSKVSWGGPTFLGSELTSPSTGQATSGDEEWFCLSHVRAQLKARGPQFPPRGSGPAPALPKRPLCKSSGAPYVALRGIRCLPFECRPREGVRKAVVARHWQALGPCCQPSFLGPRYRCIELFQGLVRLALCRSFHAHLLASRGYPQCPS